MSAAGWVLWLGVAGGIAFTLWQRAASSVARFFLPALMFKLTCGVALGWLYLHIFQQGDTFLFFQDGVQIASLAQNDPAGYLSFLWHARNSTAVWHELAFTEPRSLFFTKILSVVCLVAGGNYWLCALWLSLISFASAWLLVNRLALWYPEYAGSFGIAFLFWPSVVFWSSGVLKETVALAALFVLVRVALEGVHTKKFTASSVVQVLFCFWIGWSLKYYWVGLLMPFLMLVVGSAHLRFWCFAAAGVVLFVIIMALHPNFFPNRLPAVIVENYSQYHFLTGGNNTFHFPGLSPDWPGVLLNSPAALFSGLFRPFVWEASTFFHLAAALENLALLVLTVITLLRFRLPVAVRGWLLPLLTYALLECTFLALSTPSWGTLTRYRVGMLPFFVLFVLMANEPLQQFFRRKSI